MAVPIPVTLLTGFLGAGKTTLLNRLLADPATGPTAVIVNEFGDLAVDGRLVVGAADDVVTLTNGCVCCEVREDLRRTVGELLAKRRRWLRPLRFDRIVLETSGMASPGPLLQTFLLDATLAAETRVDGVVTVVSAADIARQLGAHPEAADQLAHADRVLLNHLDRVDAAEADRAEALVRTAAPLAEVIRCAPRADTPVPPLLDLRRADTGWRFTPPVARHTAGVVTLALRAEGDLDVQKLKMFLQFVASNRSWELLRGKGILRCRGEARPVVVHAVHQWLELGPGAGERPERSVLVLIGRGLDEAVLQLGWDAVTSGPV